ncbi:DNA/RNA non-specific endonuclease [Chitinophaga vietnamensis]|uniref:DNA/RNA non-specific endonuclease n=1 Tax=Chitinophaga vietnamensis TaxID=2593957 RepID=UPI0011779EA0|nr:DNA/RNA non-specific endonuclease [Chitinophaga vietnamensis]
MPKKKKKSDDNSLSLIIVLIVIALIVTFCSRKFNTDAPQKELPKKSHHKKKTARRHAPKALLLEDFEQGSKTNYNSGDVDLGSGSWEFKDAVTGGGELDHKQGSQALRIRANGSAAMNFDIVVNGTVTVTLKHALYGKDTTAAEWELWASVNKGQRYFKAGNTVSTGSRQLQTATFSVSTTNTIRFQIRKTERDDARLNFDAFVVRYAGPAPERNDMPAGDAVAGDDDHLLLGNPSNASASLAMANNYLMDKGYYKLSYNRDRGTPNWVCWHISRRDLGNMNRANDFRADMDLPSTWYAVAQTSYIGSGFDRGHNCPSGDRTNTRDANEATFLMTNMIPQAPMHNQHLWAYLEDYTRGLVKKGNEVYVIMGSYGVGGTGSKGFREKIDHDRITVPDHIWKVILVLPEGNNDLKRINKNTRIIAVNTPNSNDVNTSWSAYLTSIAEIEQATHLKLLSKVPEAVRQELVKKIDHAEY